MIDLAEQGKRQRQIVDTIVEERMYQDSKWGDVEQHPHSVIEWMLIAERQLIHIKEVWHEGDKTEWFLREMEESFGVAEGDIDEWMAEHATEARMLRYIQRCAAVCFACLEQYGVVPTGR